MKFFRRPQQPDEERSPSSPLDTATALYLAGRYAEAEAEACSVAEARRPRGRDDVYAPLAQSIVALAIGAQGRHTESCAAYDAVLPIFGRVFGAEHIQTLKVRSERAQQLTAMGRHAECEAECRAVLAATARGRHPQIPLVAAAARNGLVFALNAQGRQDEAESLAREALDEYRDQDRFALVLRLGLTRSLSGQGRYKEALAEAHHADEVRRSLAKDQRRAETGAVELAEATALLGLDRSAEALLLTEAAHDACLTAFGPDHRRTKEAQALLDRMRGT